MTTFLIYIIRWTVTLTLLYSAFGLLLRKETFHALNRSVLLGVLVASMVLPLCPFETRRTTMVQEGVATVETAVSNSIEEAMELPLTREGDKEGKGNDERAAYKKGVGVRLMVWTYMGGLAVAWGHYLIALAMLFWTIRSGRRIHVADVPESVSVKVNEGVSSTFSWMRWIVLSPADLGRELRPIVTHEMGHIRRGHSWDMLLCDIATRMLWFLPFVWMLRRDLADIHEYEADRYVLQQGYEGEEYSCLLIEKATSMGLQPIVNGFNRSSTKNRLRMMYKKKSTRKAALKLLYMLPLLAFAITAFARPTLMEDLQHGLEFYKNMNPEGHKGTPQTKLHPTNGEPVAVLDSTMAAVGARRIADGVYVGAFRPNFTSDTIRVQTVYLDNEKAEHIKEHHFPKRGDGGYTVELMVESRGELGQGYHIRWMRPNKAPKNAVHVNNAPIDPQWRPANVTRDEARHRDMCVVQGKDETRLIIYMTTDDSVGDEDLDCLAVDFGEVALIDPKTGDRYMCRRVENFEDKLAVLSLDNSKRGVVVQFTGIYPPIPKRVKRVALAYHDNNGWHQTETMFDLNREGHPVRTIR